MAGEIVVYEANAQQGLAQLRAKNPKALAYLLNDVAEWGRIRACQTAPVDRGPLSQMIYTEEASTSKGAKLESRIVSDQEYSATIERGARPFWPPEGALKRWSKFREVEKKKGGTDTSDFFLRRHISKAGIKAHPFMGPTAKAIPAAVSEFADQYLASLAAGMKYTQTRDEGGKAAGRNVAAKMEAKQMKGGDCGGQKRPAHGTMAAHYLDTSGGRQGKWGGAYLNPKTGKWTSTHPGGLTKGTGSKTTTGKMPTGPFHYGTTTRPPAAFTTKSALRRSTYKGPALKKHDWSRDV